MQVLRTSNIQWATTRTDSSETETLCLNCSPLNFLLRALIQKQGSSITFLPFRNEELESRNVSNETKPGEKPTKITVCLQNISRTGTVQLGIFHGRTLWDDRVSPRASTIASREQFKPIRIGENLVLNYND